MANELDEPGDQSSKPLELPYARRSGGRTIPKWAVKSVVAALALLILGVSAFLTADSFAEWTRVSSCAHCGAFLSESGRSIFGHNIASSRSIHEGRVSTLIQSMENAKCAHRWESSMYSSRTLGGARGCGGWSDNGRFQRINRLESDAEILNDISNQILAGNTQLFEQLCKAVRTLNKLEADEASFDLIDRAQNSPISASSQSTP